MAMRVKMVSGGYEEVRDDGEKPKGFEIRDLFPFGATEPLEPHKLRPVSITAQEYADNMGANFYQLTRRIGERDAFSWNHNPHIQLYVHNQSCQQQVSQARESPYDLSSHSVLKKLT